MRTRIFLDFWNFTLNWRNHTNSSDKCDWTSVPSVLLKQADETLDSSKLGSLELQETRIYASYEPSRDSRLKNWLHNFLDRQPGVRVFTFERRWRQRPTHCRFCGFEHTVCSECSKPLGRAIEKGVDSRIVSDMLSLAWDQSYDVALLVSSDKDFIPAVRKLQEKNIRVVNATWRGYGNELAHECWCSFELDHLIIDLVRS